jgi:hypothetical protein
MRYLLFITVLGVCVRRSADSAPAHATRPPIFRQVSFPPYSAITLGEPLPKGAPPIVTVGPRRAALANRLGDTDSIFVEWDAGMRVRAIEFVYPSTKSVSKAVADYEGLIAADERHTVADSAGQRLERWLWMDQQTTFEFSFVTVGENPARLWSILHDEKRPEHEASPSIMPSGSQYVPMNSLRPSGVDGRK